METVAGLKVALGLERVDLVGGDGRDDVNEGVDDGSMPGQIKGRELFDMADDGLNGLITNDKFCLSRPGRLSLSWWRYPLRLRDPAPKGADPVPDLEGDRGGGHEAPLAGSPSDAAGFGRSPAVGSGLHAHSELGVARHRLGARRAKRALPTSSGGEP